MTFVRGIATFSRVEDRLGVLQGQTYSQTTRGCTQCRQGIKLPPLKAFPQQGYTLTTWVRFEMASPDTQAEAPTLFTYRVLQYCVSCEFTFRSPRVSRSCPHSPSLIAASQR